MSMWMQTGFSDPKASNAKDLILYHDMTMIVAVVVMSIVGGFLMIFLCKGTFMKNLTARCYYKNNKAELIWGSAPVVPLAILAYYSLLALYRHEVGQNVENLVKTTAQQWYWEYEYNVDMSSVDKDWLVVFMGYFLSSGDYFYEVDHEHSVGGSSSNESEVNGFLYSEFDKEDDNQFFMELVSEKKSLSGEVSYSALLFENSWIKDFILGVYSMFMNGEWYLVQESFNIADDMVSKGGLRHLDVSEPCYFIRSVKNELSLVTADVMHSWGVPELGVKVDAIPGRSNSIAVVPYESGAVHGHCYELCGVGHSQMPITSVIVSKPTFTIIMKELILQGDIETDWIFTKMDFLKNSLGSYSNGL